MKRTVPPSDLKKIKLAPGHATAGEFRRVPVADIHVLDNLNLRVRGTPEYDEAVNEFAASIEANGFYDDKPLAGYIDADGKVIVIDGHRRLEAVQRLNGASLDGDIVTEVPVVLKSEDSTLADLTIAMIQSSSGRELTMFEKGIGVKRLMSDGMDKASIAHRLGVSEKTIDNYIIVASVPAKARDLLLDDKVTSTQVLRTKGDVGKLQSMVDKAAAAGRTRARPSDAEHAFDTAVANGDGVLKVEQQMQGESRAFDTDMKSVQRDDTASVPTGSPQNSVSAAPADEAMTFTIPIVKDAEMGAMMRQIATEIRSRVQHDQGDADAALVNGTIRVSVSLAVAEKPKRVRKPRVDVVTSDEASVAEVTDTGPTIDDVPAELAHAIPDEL